MNGNKYIVITSINAPGEAIVEFSKWDGWRVVVVGDRKTPENWHNDSIMYLGIAKQREMFGDFAETIPENTYIRKMMGYAYAIRHGAIAIFESDDDNIPYPDSVKTINGIIRAGRLDGERCRSGNHWLNAYSLFGASYCWPRGFPLEYIKDSSSYEARPGIDDKPWAIMGFLIDEDPDVDAIYRMVDGRTIRFAKGQIFILDEGTYCPINSQATLWMPEAFPLLFLPVGVTDRVTDILRGYIASACLWKAGYAVAVAGPIVYQKRNTHDLHNDFIQEMPLYLSADVWCRGLSEIEETDVVDAYRSAIKILVKMQAVPEKNLYLYDMFLTAGGLK